MFDLTDFSIISRGFNRQVHAYFLQNENVRGEIRWIALFFP